MTGVKIIVNTEFNRLQNKARKYIYIVSLKLCIILREQVASYDLRAIRYIWKDFATYKQLQCCLTFPFGDSSGKLFGSIYSVVININFANYCKHFAIQFELDWGEAKFTVWNNMFQLSSMLSRQKRGNETMFKSCFQWSQSFHWLQMGVLSLLKIKESHLFVMNHYGIYCTAIVLSQRIIIINVFFQPSFCSTFLLAV